MEERDMLTKIAESAKELKVPKELEPEQVRQQLKDEHAGKRKEKKWNLYRSIAAAACLCICFGAGGLSYRNYTKQQAQSAQVQAEKDKKAAAGQEARKDPAELEGHTITDTEAGENADFSEKEEGAVDDAAKEAPVKKLGKMYTLASDYSDVYDTLKKVKASQLARSEQAKMENSVMGSEKDAVFGSEEDVDYNAGMTDLSGSVKETASAAADDSSGAQTSGADSDFSSTNLQVEGVDESDIVKTDGSFIYVVQDVQIQVLDVRNQQIPAAAGTISPNLDEDTDRICEMYVADNTLTLIIQTEKTSLKGEIVQDDGANITDSGEDNQNLDEAPNLALRSASDDVQYLDTKAAVKVVTYDLSDPQKPALKNTAMQDGWYQTSRKIGNRLYLFTNQTLGISDDMLREEAVKEDQLGLWLPCVNGKVVSSDCIYLPDRGNQGLLMTSMDLADQNKVLDTKLLVNNYAQLYVSSRSVYLYYGEYVNGSDRTRIARFGLEADGTIRAKAAKTVKGSIQDTFAIHERDGYLQVLTSVTNADPWENRVYVLDENMETAGKLTGLAKGERIHSARFTGTVGYFVTYRNTDPLFTVDFSDPKEPKVIGELEVTGFSEYLHFWSDDRLLGIGYETDPDSGRTLGVKLSMFDISDPAKVKEEARLVLDGADNCDGMYDYKAVLVDRKKNLIAFTTEKYSEGYQEDYRVFSYMDGKFVSRIERRLTTDDFGSADSQWRSVYVGDMLYLVSERKVLVFAMNADWKEIGKLIYGWKSEEKEDRMLYD